MKRSKKVPATLLIAMAAASSLTAGCGSNRQCQDQYGNPLPSSACANRTSGARWVVIPRSGFGSSGSSGFSS